MSDKRKSLLQDVVVATRCAAEQHTIDTRERMLLAVAAARLEKYPFIINEMSREIGRLRGKVKNMVMQIDEINDRHDKHINNEVVSRLRRMADKIEVKLQADDDDEDEGEYDD